MVQIGAIQKDLPSDVYLSLNKSADACVGAIQSGHMNPVFFKPDNNRFTAKDLEAFSQMRKINGVESALKKVIIGSASWVLNEISNHQERVLDSCDYTRLLDYNLPISTPASNYEDLYSDYLENQMK